MFESCSEMALQIFVFAIFLRKERAEHINSLKILGIAR